MTADLPPRFTARDRQTNEPESLTDRQRDRLLAEIARLRSRLERAARDGKEAFADEQSDAHDIGTLAVIHLADLVHRQLPAEIGETLPRRAFEGLRATRNIAAHNYAGMDNSRLWETVTVAAPELLSLIEGELRRQ